MIPAFISKAAFKVATPDRMTRLALFLVKSMSGPLKAAIKRSIPEWEAAAKETENPVDDMLVALVKHGLEAL